MSQAEQVPEDVPAYLNDEPVGTGKPLAFNTHRYIFFPHLSQYFQGTFVILCCGNWEYEK